MCGILGRVGADGFVNRAVFVRMLETLAARGPDGSGLQILDEGRVGLGHRRLSIIDLSDAGSQPMPNEDGTVWLTFNGEIYNYRALRKELEAGGHRFRSHSDSEVIVHGYEEWGDDCVTRLRGIFAFGIWDQTRRRLLLARDHLGVKPLYYTTDPRCFTFASQPRAIVEDPAFQRRLDLSALRDYLAYGVVPWDRAIFRGMAKLPPAHRLVLEDGRIRIERYWELRYEPTLTDAVEAERVLRAKLEEVVHAQMVSDVPVGVFLSGGIDSSVLTAIASQHEQEVLNTFTIGFEEAKKDERAFANLVVELFQTKHHERVLDFTTARSLIADLVEHYDEPFYYGSSFATYYVSKLAQSCGIKVILGGDGADELFAGYTRYDEFHDTMNAPWPGRLANTASRLLRGQRPFDPRSDPMADYFRYEGRLGWREQRPLFTTAAARELDPDVVWRLRRFYDPAYPAVTAAQVVDLHGFLVDEILSKVDRASMACGVEVRVPFLDLELVELAFSISSDVVYHRSERKSLLKRSVRDLLPSTVLTARKKGFSTPMKQWMRRGILEHGAPLLLDGRLVGGGVLDRAGVARLIEHGSPKHAWLLLVAELWARRWLEGEQEIRSLFPADPRLWDRAEAGSPGAAH